MLQGEFKDNKYDGNGTYHWKDGSVYSGGWREGKYVHRMVSCVFMIHACVVRRRPHIFHCDNACSIVFVVCAERVRARVHDVLLFAVCCCRMHGQGAYTDSDGVNWSGQFYNGKFFNGKAYLALKAL